MEISNCSFIRGTKRNAKIKDSLHFPATEVFVEVVLEILE
jgi:hypothetical protein